MPSSRKETLRSALTIALIAMSLRCAMSCVGPLTGDFQADLGLSAFAAGFVTTIPLIAFSLTAPVAGKIAVAVRSKELILACLSLTAVGLLLRSFGGVVGLYAGTGCMGLAIGTMNVLMPALIRKQYPNQIGLMMGIYMTAMTAASSIFSGACEGIARALGGWQMGLAAPILVVCISIVTCLLSGNRLAVKLNTTGTVSAGCIKPKHIAVAVYMGIQSFIYFSMLAWLPAMAQSQGAVRGDTGILLLVMQACGLVPCFVMPIVTQKVRRRDILCFCTASLFVGCFLCILLWGSSYAMLMVGTMLCGFGCSGTLSISLTIIAQQGRNAAETAVISALSQCIGYALSAFGPTGLGYLFDAFGNWKIVLLCMVVLSTVMTFLGLYAGRPEKEG